MPPKGEGRLLWIVTAPVVVVIALPAYLVYLIHLAFVLVVNRVVPDSTQGQLGAWLSKYAAALVLGAFVLGMAYLIFADDDPCGDERREYQAYNIVLEVPEFPFDDAGSADTYFLVTDRIKDRYPDLWQERERALDSWGYCEESNRPDPGDFDRGF